MNASQYLPMKQYFAEITRIPLLEQEEELALGRRIQEGDDEAREQLIVANLRLVATIAHQFTYSGLPVDDLIEEGNIGLMEAVDRFDPENGARFSTYAAWWIKHSIRRAVHNYSRTVRLPSNVYEKAGLIDRVNELIQNEIGREATAVDVSTIVGIPEASITKIQRAMKSPSPLDAPVGEDTSATIGDQLQDESAPEPDRVARIRDGLANVLKLMATLSEREREILKRRFGLDGTIPETLVQIGKSLKVSSERIRQIEEKALTKLRSEIQKLEIPNDLPSTGDILNGDFSNMAIPA